MADETLDHSLRLAATNI